MRTYFLNYVGEEYFSGRCLDLKVFDRLKDAKAFVLDNNIKHYWLVGRKCDNSLNRLIAISDSEWSASEGLRIKSVLNSPKGYK